MAREPTRPGQGRRCAFAQTCHDKTPVAAADLARQHALSPRGEVDEPATDLTRQCRVARYGRGEHRQQKDQSFGDARIIGRHVQHQENIDDNHQDVGADDRADRAAATAAEARPTDNDRGEDRQEERIADERIARARLRADKDAGKTIEAAREHIDAKTHQHDTDACRSGCVGVASNGVDRSSEPRVLQPQPKRDQRQEKHDRHGQPAGNGVP